MSVKWRDKGYTVYEGSLAGGAVTMTVSWREDSFRVRVQNRQLAKGIRELDEAKAAAERLAIKIVNEALNELQWERRENYGKNVSHRIQEGWRNPGHPGYANEGRAFLRNLEILGRAGNHEGRIEREEGANPGLH